MSSCEKYSSYQFFDAENRFTSFMDLLATASNRSFKKSLWILHSNVLSVYKIKMKGINFKAIVGFHRFLVEPGGIRNNDMSRSASFLKFVV